MAGLSLTAGTTSIVTSNLSFSIYESCTVGVSELEKNVFVKLYPNPSHGAFNLQIDADITNGKLILYNAMGLNLGEHEVQKGANIIVTTELSQGMYHYTLLEKNGLVHAGKIILE